MNNQNLIIFNFKSLYVILKELEEHLNYKILESPNIKNLNDKIKSSKNYLIICQKKMNDIDFIAYELIKYPNQKNGIRPSDQMQLLQQMNVLTVQNRLVNELSNTMLSDILQDLRRSYDYEIDGIIVKKIYNELDNWIIILNKR